MDFLEDVFQKKSRKVFCGIAMVQIMVATSMVIGQQQSKALRRSYGASETPDGELETPWDVGNATPRWVTPLHVSNAQPSSSLVVWGVPNAHSLSQCPNSLSFNIWGVLNAQLGVGNVSIQRATGRCT
ncbi:hypothetical protein PIB30_047096 [Stylosanthes scabra]|uniref:Uncharacterized protein n=1 Tax=Stylosanthes scabra TaxID=79078 RepID=A0ABU6YFE5_9FABA|nr:hypothetical protein [Stylosanthes scabra]